MKRSFRPAVFAAALLALTTLGATPATAPDGDINQDGSVDVLDLQCVIRLGVALAEGTTCTTDADCGDRPWRCREGFSATTLCIPTCVADPVSVGVDRAGPCLDPAADDADCLGLTPRRNADLDCDGAIDEADADLVKALVFDRVTRFGVADIDGDRRLDGCDADRDGDGLPNDADCAPSDPAVGVCDDGDACTTDACFDEACVFTPYVCDDGIACTADGCDGEGGCIFTPDDTACEDDNPCTAGTCVLGVGCGQAPVGTPIPCSTPTFDGACAPDGVCRELAGPGGAVIVELMAAPGCTGDPAGEWFEVYNRGPGPIDLAGWTITSDGDTADVILASVPIAAYESALLCRAAAGSPDCAYTYDDVTLATAADSLALLDPAGTEVDRVSWSGGTTGASLSLSPGLFDAEVNDSASAWCDGSTTFGDCPVPDRGSPGTLNPLCSQDVCGATTTVGCGDVVVGDTTGLPNAFGAWGCTLRDLSGGEQAFVFESATRQIVTVTLDASVDLDVLVLPQSCDAGACLTHGDTEAAFTAAAGTPYALVVDGLAEARGPFALSVSCQVAPAEICDDGTDNDGDGIADCFDTDCFEAPECDRDCLVDSDAACDDVLTGSTVGQLDEITWYPGCEDVALDGGERVYRVVPSENTVLTATLSDLTTDLRVLILNAACNAYNCTDSGAVEAAREVAAGEPYFVVVDGPAAGAGDFTLSLDCGLRELDCADGLDNDADGLTDCADGDCAADPACVEVCDDGVDNDADGLVDCGDPECADALGCCTATDTIACDSVDRGTTVGADRQVSTYECVQWAETGPERIYALTPTADGPITVRLDGVAPQIDVFLMEQGCGAPHCTEFGDESITFQATAGETYHLAVDGFDQFAGDYTLVVDCGDLRERLCDDGTDDDADGLVDCDDPDCAAADACRTVCSDLAIPLPCGHTLAGNNAGKEDRLQTYGCGACSDWPELAGEAIYQVEQRLTGPLQVDVVPAAADLDVFVIDQPCDLTADPVCLTCGDQGVSFQAEGGRSYYVFVDGFMGAEGAYTITSSCGGGSAETACSDGTDNDGDGAADCADSDCQHHGACAGSTCTPDHVIRCGDVVSSTTEGQPNEMGTYDCAPIFYGGGESVYAFVAPTSGTVTATLLSSDPFADHDISVLDGGCGTAYCTANGADEVTVPVTAGQTYYFSIDGQFGDGTFDLALTCNL